MTNTLASGLPFGSVVSSNFRFMLDKSLELFGGFKTKTLFDSSIHDISFDSALGDASSILNKNSSLSAISMFENFVSEMEDNRTDSNIDSFISNVDKSMFQNVADNQDAIIKSQEIADASNLYYDQKLDDQGITKDDWSDVIVDISNGVDNDLLNSVKELNTATK